MALAVLAIEAVYAVTAGEVGYLAQMFGSQIPLKHVVAEQWQDGVIPLWSSAVGTGQALAADALSLPFDWRNLFLLLPIPAIDGYVLAAVATRVLAAAITFAYLRRRVGAGGLASFAGALLFLSSTSLIEEGTAISSGVVAFPAIVWLSERLFEATTPGRVIALGAAWGLFLAMNTLAYIPYLAGGAFLWCLLLAGLGDGLTRRAVGRFALAFGLAGAIGCALMAVTLLPQLELAGVSNRGGEYRSDPFALHSLLSAFIGANQGSAVYPSGAFYFYVGIISFAPIAVALRRPARRHVRAALALGLGMAVVLLVGFVAKPVLVDVIPGLATVPLFRPAFLIGFAAAVLVARGLDEPDWNLGPRARAAVGTLFVLQAAILVAGVVLAAILATMKFEAEASYLALRGFLDPLEPGVLAVVLVAIRAAGLGAALLRPGESSFRIGAARLSRPALVAVLLVAEVALAWGIARPRAVDSFRFRETEEVRFLQERTGDELRAMGVLLRPEWAGEVIGAYNASLSQNGPAYEDVPTVNSYSSLIPEHVSEVFDDFGDEDLRRDAFERAPNAVLETSSYDSPLIRALGVGYLFSSAPLESPRNSTLVLRGEDAYVYEVKDPLPRAFFAGRARRLPEDEVHEQLRAVAADRPGAVELGPEVLIEGEPSVEGSPLLAPADVVEDTGSRVEVAVEAPRPGFLVLSDVDLAGWTAEVDGEQAEIERANGFARAVRVPAGTHTVEFAYRPSGLVAGAVISVAAALGCLAVLLVSRRRRRRAGSDGTEPGTAATAT